MSIPKKMKINYVVCSSNFLISDGINKKLTILGKLGYMFCDIDVRKVQFIKPKDIQEMKIDNWKLDDDDYKLQRNVVKKID